MGRVDAVDLARLVDLARIEREQAMRRVEQARLRAEVAKLAEVIMGQLSVEEIFPNLVNLSTLAGAGNTEASETDLDQVERRLRAVEREVPDEVVRYAFHVVLRDLRAWQRDWKCCPECEGGAEVRVTFLCPPDPPGHLPVVVGGPPRPAYLDPLGRCPEFRIECRCCGFTGPCFRDEKGELLHYDPTPPPPPLPPVWFELCALQSAARGHFAERLSEFSARRAHDPTRPEAQEARRKLRALSEMILETRGER